MLYSMFGSMVFPPPSNIGFRFNFNSDDTYFVSILRKMVDSKLNQVVGQKNLLVIPSKSCGFYNPTNFRLDKEQEELEG